MEIRIKVTLILFMLSFLMGCKSQNKDSSVTNPNEGDAFLDGGTSGNVYKTEIITLRDKIRNHKANRTDMLALCEKLLGNESVKKDTATLEGIYFTYGIYLDGEKQFTKAETALHSAETIVLNNHTKNQKFLLASIYTALAKIYGGLKSIDKQLAMLKYVIENFQDVDLPPANIKEYYSTFAANTLGSIYEKTRRYDDGLNYFDSITQKYSNTRTSHAAQVQIYNLQMSKGDTVAADSTEKVLQKQLEEHPDYTIISSNVLEKWKAIKKGATQHEKKE